MDSEAIRVAPDGTVWISDEYGPYILHFDRNGNEIGQLALPPGFQISNPGPTATYEAANNTTGRTTNRGMEGLAISPDGNTLVGMMQSSLTQDGGLTGTNDRILVYDLTNPTAAPKQYLYQLDSTATPISELLAINSHKFLVDERDGNGGATGIKKLYQVDFNQATAPTELTTTAYSGTTASNGLPATGTPSGVVPLQKTLFADIGAILNSATPSPFTAVNGKNGLPDKIEGYSWGPDLPDGRHLLLATNDNDFVQPGGAAGAGYPNYIFAFAVDSADVPDFQAQKFNSQNSTPPALARDRIRFGRSYRGSLLVAERLGCSQRLNHCAKHSARPNRVGRVREPRNRRRARERGLRRQLLRGPNALKGKTRLPIGLSH